MTNISTEFGDGKIFKSTLNKEIELHSWTIRNLKEYKKFNIKAPHFHEEFQVGYLKRGIIENFYRKKKVIIQSNQLYIIEPEEIHSEYLLQEKEAIFDFIFIPNALMDQANIDLNYRKRRFFQDLVIDNKTVSLQLTKELQATFNSYKCLSTHLEREENLINFNELYI